MSNSINDAQKPNMSVALNNHEAKTWYYGLCIGDKSVSAI